VLDRIDRDDRDDGVDRLDHHDSMDLSDFRRTWKFGLYACARLSCPSSSGRLPPLEVFHIVESPDGKWLNSVGFWWDPGAFTTEQNDDGLRACWVLAFTAGYVWLTRCIERSRVAASADKLPIVSIERRVMEQIRWVISSMMFPSGCLYLKPSSFNDQRNRRPDIGRKVSGSECHHYSHSTNSALTP